MLAGAFAGPVASFRALPWTARGARSLGGMGVRTGLTLAVTALLVLVFGGLFVSADAAFARAVSAVTPELRAPTLFRWLFLLVSGALVSLGAAYLVTRPPDLEGLERPGAGRLRPFEWGLPVAALDLLFAAFVAVQSTVLFGGRAHVLGQNGPDFADYARGGFSQLLLVSLLTLVVLGAAARWARRDGQRDRALIRFLLGTLAVLALVVVASALHRMYVYEDAYGYTRLRLLVFACELWLGVVFALILVAGIGMRAGWLPRAALFTAVVALIGLVVLNPDRFIAERNIERYADKGVIDLEYLAGLSADAAPALDKLRPELRACTLSRISWDLNQDPDDWRGANLGRARARAIIRDTPLDHDLGDEARLITCY